MATIQAHKEKSDQIKLYLGSDGDGLLSDCGIPIQHYWYKRCQHRLLTLFSYLFSQLLLFFALLRDRSIDKQAIIYVNTLLPFGAALYGKLTGRKVIYHVHEISITPSPLKWLLTNIARLTSSLNFYVSDAHMQAMVIPDVPSQRIYNALDAQFLRRAHASTYSHRHNGRFNILMIASLRDYKGVPELLQIASLLDDRKDLHFDLLVSDDITTINHYFIDRNIPKNLTIHLRTDDTIPFYSNSSLVLNLSRVDLCVETFGLTILEAMSFGIPVIAPPVGGPTELVDNGVSGYLIDSRAIENVAAKIIELAHNPGLCQQVSNAARVKAKGFSPEQFTQNIIAAIGSLQKTTVSR